MLCPRLGGLSEVTALVSYLWRGGEFLRMVVSVPGNECLGMALDHRPRDLLDYHSWWDFRWLGPSTLSLPLAWSMAHSCLGSLPD